MTDAELVVMTISRPAEIFMARNLLRAAIERTAVDADTAILVASELITNAIVHTRGPCEVRASCCDGHLRVEVDDPLALPFDPHSPLEPTDGGGRGFSIVEQLVSRWGFETRPPWGKTIWFELDAAPGGRSQPPGGRYGAAVPEFAVVREQGVGDSRAWLLTISGELDLATTEPMEDAFNDVLGLGARLVTLDLSAVTFLDSTGLRSIVAASKRLEERGGRLVVSGLSGAAQRVLEISGVIDRLTDPRTNTDSAVDPRP